MIEMLSRPRMFGKRKHVGQDVFIMTAINYCHRARGRKKWFLNHRRKQAARSLHQYHIISYPNFDIAVFPELRTMRSHTPISFNNYYTTRLTCPSSSTSGFLFGKITPSAPTTHSHPHRTPPILRCPPCSSPGPVQLLCASHSHS